MTDDEMRTLLEDAVADVEPRYALADIRSRTTRPRRRSWVWGVSGAVVATAATVAAVVCFTHLSGGGDPSPAPAGQHHGTAAGPTVKVYFVGTTGVGLRLFPELVPTGSQTSAVDDAVAIAVEGAVSDPDYESPWPRGSMVQRAQLSHGVLSVDLSGPVVRRPTGMSRSEAALALQQLVYTAQSAAGSRLPVTFLVEGRRADSLLGLPTRQPVPAAAADDTVTAVSILSLRGDPAMATSPLTVKGEASAFEGNVQWQLVQGGKVVRRGYATTKQCCQLSPYAFRVQAPAGEYTLVVHDEDVSDGEGLGVTTDTKRIALR